MDQEVLLKAHKNNLKNNLINQIQKLNFERMIQNIFIIIISIIKSFILLSQNKNLIYFYLLNKNYSKYNFVL